MIDQNKLAGILGSQIAGKATECMGVVGVQLQADSQKPTIEGLQHDLDLYRDALQSVVMSELPESELDAEQPGDFVRLKVSHMDHEAYREAVRVAAAVIGIDRVPAWNR
jgi:hypothetical protein